MVHVTVSAPVRPTEDPERVVAACTAFWSDGSVEAGEDSVRVEAQGVTDFRLRVWELRIIDTVRARLLAGVDGDRIRFTLSKQAAYARRVSFPPSPHTLGDIVVEMRVEEADPWQDAEALAWYICPETRNGEIVKAATE